MGPGRVSRNLTLMDPMQEILETVREIRKSQIEALAWRGRAVRKQRIFFIVLLIFLAAYIFWTFRFVK